jgi:NMD protein affecting ribosome stability and mRNA decay
MSKVICPKCGEREEIVRSLDVVCRYDEHSDEYFPTEETWLVSKCRECGTELEKA